MILLVLMIIVVALQLAGQVLLKKGLSRIPAPLRQAGPVPFLKGVFGIQLVWLAIALLALWYFFYLGILTRFDISQVFPISTLDMVLLLLVARVVLREKVTPLRWVGAGLIMAGVWLVAGS